MPKYVDHDARRQDILAAAGQVIGEAGMRGFTFRAVAQVLGGSTTLITHYYPSQRELIDDFAESLVERWKSDVAELEASEPDPCRRLQLLIEWLLPLDESGLSENRARINLLADQIVGDGHRRIFDAWDVQVRGFLRDHVERIVPEERVEAAVELLRTVSNGIVLSVIEHPDQWDRSRQLAIMDQTLDHLGLRASVSATRA